MAVLKSGQCFYIQVLNNNTRTKEINKDKKKQIKYGKS